METPDVENPSATAQPETGKTGQTPTEADAGKKNREKEPSSLCAEYDEILVKIKKEGKIMVELSSVIYLASSGSQTLIYIAGRKNPYVSIMNLGHYEKKLCGKKFWRIHDYYIVNITKIEKIEEIGDGLVHMKDGYKLKVSRKYSKSFNALLRSLT